MTNELHFAIDKISLLLRRNLLSVLRKYKLTPEQWEILLLFPAENSINQNYIIEKTLKDKGNVSRILNRLRNGNWIKTTQPQDTRIQNNLITPKAVQALRDIEEAMGPYNKMLHSAAQDQNILSILSKLQDQIESFNKTIS